MIYHIGIYQRNHTLIIQASTNVDCLSCEILAYMGTTTATKKELRANCKDEKKRNDFLAIFNRRYPNRNFKSIIVE